MTAPISRKQAHSITHADDTKITLWVGAVSAGKTIASLFAFLFAVQEATGVGLIVIVGKTLQTIERNLFDPLQSYAIFGPLARHIKHTKGSSVAMIFGKTVELVGANDVRSEEKIRGSTIELGYVDEATILPEGFWRMFVSRFRTPEEGHIYATTNPASTRHWLRQEWILRADEVNMQVFHFTMDDNPSLTETYVRDMKASFTGVFYQRMIEGKWTNAEGAVFDTWDEKQHVIRYEDLPRMDRVFCIGLDYGTTNATSAIMLGTAGGKLYAIDEWRYDSKEKHATYKDVTLQKESISDRLITNGILEWLRDARLPYGPRPNPEYIIHDPSAASLRTEMWERGITNLLAANNDVLYGIRTVASVLSAGKLIVTDKCQGLIGEMPEYSWDPKATLRGEDKPLKRDDHSVDALRYAVTTTESEWRYYVNLSE